MVLEPHNFILADLAAGLNLDDLQRILAWILDTLHATHRNAGRLIHISGGNYAPGRGSGGNYAPGRGGA
jgi:hypothetical protein